MSADPGDQEDKADEAADRGMVAPNSEQNGDAPRGRYRFSFMGLGESGHRDTAERMEEILAAEWTPDGMDAKRAEE